MEAPPSQAEDTQPPPSPSETRKRSLEETTLNDTPNDADDKSNNADADDDAGVTLMVDRIVERARSIRARDANSAFAAAARAAASALTRAALVKPKQLPARLPPDWAVHFDSAHRLYFYHQGESGVSSWEFPADPHLDPVEDAVPEEEDDTSASDATPAAGTSAPPAKAKKKVRGRDPSGAQFWYYFDASGTKHGPHYPGHMRDWFLAGHFPENTSVAPAFSGKCPTSGDYTPIDDLFEAPLSSSAFVWSEGKGVAPYPPDPTPGTEGNGDGGGDDDDEEEAEAKAKAAGGTGSAWLDKALANPSRDGRAGPVLKGSFCDLHW